MMDDLPDRPRVSSRGKIQTRFGESGNRSL
jgi:hypothetical protein